ncbi:MAG: VCBS repeat-containing protein [Cyclobacteriaceae bacterium]|nr:VCBS repeat-containing protein [Cyclobacteriaceae bacterium]
MQRLTALTFISCVLAIVSQAQIASTFNTNADGWILRNDGKSISATVTHHATGGNPGGYISGEVPVDNYPAFFWQAPEKFRGNLTYRSFGQTLTFSLQQALSGDNGEFNGNYDEVNYPDVIISNGSQTIYLHTSPKPELAPGWSTYSVTLSTASAWRTGSSMLSGLATNAQIKAVLNNVTTLHIRANYNLSANTLGLSNVSLGQRTLLTPPSISGISDTSGKPGSILTITGNNFATNSDDNLVYFGGVLATISSVSTTQLVVTIPTGATYDYIKIVNKVTGLTTSSANPFVPTFNDGGRIIAASFKPKIEIPTSSDNMLSMKVADIDGDGWNDLVITETSNTVSIFRNKGTGNDLTADSFENKVTLSGGGNQTGLFIADADGDGRLDIITGFSNGFQKSFATFRNTSSPGTISFETVELWPGLVYSGITSEAIDIDGDGLVDLIGQHQNGSAAPDFWVAQNISTPGNIEFGAPVGFFGSFAVDAGVNVTAGDLNGDGKPDVLIKYGFGGSFAIAQNTSTPGVISFGPPIAFSRSSYGRLVIGDFNNDGKNDIAVRHGFFNDDIILFMNNDTDGALTASDFSTQVIIDSELFAGGNISVADVNGDGRPDFVLTDGTYFGVFENVYMGGVFNANAFVPAYLVGTEGAWLNEAPPVIADLNGDGQPEIIVYVTATNPRAFAIYENINAQAPVISLNTITPLSGPIGSSVTITGSNFSIVPAENSVMFGAVRGTVTAASETSLTVTVPAGASMAKISVTRDRLTSTYHLPFTPTFSGGVSFDNTHFAPPVSFPVSSVQYDPEVADLNNDGKPDIMVNGSGNGLTFRNTHTSGSLSATSLTAGTTANSASPPRLMDLDGDGKLDLVGGSNVFRNISSGDPIDYSTSVYISPGGFFFNDFADFNRDGRIDFIGVNGSVVSLIENRTTVGAFLGLTRASSFSNSIQFSKPAVGGSVVAADFDSDGETDIAATNPGTDNVSVWKNNGAYRITTTQFTTLPVITVGDNPSRIYTGDFDRDGKIDLLIIHSTGTTSTQITILQNQSTPGNISFSAPLNLINPSALTVAHVADLDGDGKPEIITTSESGNRFSIFKNIHTSGALTATSFAAPFNTTVTGPRGITTGDLNVDGKPEIILTRAAGLLEVYQNLIPTTSITISTQPITPNNICVGSSALFTTEASGTTNITYQWQKFNSGTSLFENLTNNAVYTGVATGTLSIANVTSTEAGNYRCLIKGDLAADVFTNVATLVVNPLPASPGVTDASTCGSGSVILSASGGTPGNYRWYTQTPLALIAGEVNETYTTPVLTTTTTYLVSIADAFCESIRVPVTATVSSVPTQPVIASSITPVGNAVTVCSSATLTLTAPAGFAAYTWSTGETTQQIAAATSGNYSVTVTNAEGCASPASASLNVTVIPEPCGNQPPVIVATVNGLFIEGVVRIDLTPLLSDPDDNLDLGSLRVLNTQTTAGATASMNSSNELILDYGGILFTGVDRISIEVCDLLGACTQQQLTINVEGDIIVRTGFSPNGDDRNDFFQIDYINLFSDTQQNKVTIYNRWGDVVFEISNYDNQTRVFTGLNKNGNELPSGTYFYKLEFKSGRPAKTGYLSLRK